MKFYNREKELDLLKKIEKLSCKSAQLTFLTGRRRVGKTTLLRECFKGQAYLYFFIGKKNEILLCEEFSETIRQVLKIEQFENFRSFSKLFAFLMELSMTKNFTLILDEFQEFYYSNPSVYSDMQHTWDRYKADSKINLICCGSIYTLMTKIFTDSKEPLYGRANFHLKIEPFDVITIKEFLCDHNPKYKNEDLLALYILSGGVPKYLEQLSLADVMDAKNLMDFYFSYNSTFLEEGKNILIDEFGKDYGNYFSILSLIAGSKTSRPEIESIMNISVGGFLDKLEVDFQLIAKIKPILSSPGSKNIKYYIKDVFLNFWFRFVYKNRSAVEMQNNAYILELLKRDYETYSGRLLERYFNDMLIKTQKYSEIGTYWEKGNQNEIDIVAVNSLHKVIDFFEIKKQKSAIRISHLEKKAEKIMQKFEGYSFGFFGLSMEDM
jgi:AAA+ ATPase superfamily predicted ATPase